MPRPIDRPGVLLIDGDILARATLAAYLRECGFRVVEANGTAEADQLLGAYGGSIGHVIATVGDESGALLAFIRGLRESHEAIEIRLAGNAEAAAAKAAELCDRGPPVKKPYDHQLVVDRVRRMRAGQARTRNGGGGGTARVAG